jgi:hypothetical protein
MWEYIYESETAVDPAISFLSDGSPTPETIYLGALTLATLCSVLILFLLPMLDLEHWEVLSDGLMMIISRYGNVVNVKYQGPVWISLFLSLWKQLTQLFWCGEFSW